MSEQNDQRSLKKLEDALCTLSLTPAKLDRDQLLFQAGQEAARKQGWRNSAISMIFGGILGCLLTFLCAKAAWIPQEKILYIAQPTEIKIPNPKANSPDATKKSPLPAPDDLPKNEMDSPSQTHENAYFIRRNRVLRHGVDALKMESSRPDSENKTPSIMYLMLRNMKNSNPQNEAF